MAISKQKICDKCLRLYLSFSGEDGDYGYTVEEFLDNNAPALDTFRQGMSSQGLYLWLVGQGGCLSCIAAVKEDMLTHLGSDALRAANENLYKNPETRKRLEELEQFAK